MTADVSSLKC